MMASLDDTIRAFARFLRASWGEAVAVARSMERVASTEFLSDWSQANWELLVETPFRESSGFGAAYLEPYGDGADCNEASSRVWRPEAAPTHRIVCLPREDAAVLDLLTNREVAGMNGGAVFDHFATRTAQGWHEEAPPFDCVLAYRDEQEVLIPLDQIAFVAEEVRRT